MPNADEKSSRPIQDDYEEYWGLSYRDVESGNEIELTPDGVHIFKTQGIKRMRFDKVIPYSEIIDVNSKRASMFRSGFLSIITATEGITENATRQQLLLDHNTVLFKRKTEPDVEQIYYALEDICNAPPASSSERGFYENEDLGTRFSPSVNNHQRKNVWDV